MASQKALWLPDKKTREQSNMVAYLNWLQKKYALSFKDYQAFWQWSVDYPENFWESLWNYFEIKSYSPYQQVLSDDPMPHVRWFEGATLNYAEHVFRNKTDKHPALIFCSERKEPEAMSWRVFEAHTAALQAYFRLQGISAGDRVAAFVPNIPQASIALMATLSLGAVWSSCSPDFGAESVLDRFRQIEPKILIAVDGYTYNGKPYDCMKQVKQIKEALPSVEQVILIPYLNEKPDSKDLDNAVLWGQVIETPHQELTFTPVPFSHPIWILYSSGTTGLPKAITHCHGGMLLEHLKYLSLHNDVKPGEHFFWFSTTGWMMWNFVQASLLAGATMVLYDGSAGYPGLTALWRLAERLPIHHFGTSAPFLLACMKKQLSPGGQFKLSALRSIGSTGSPLPPEAFDYVYEQIKKDVWLCSMSGGTDVCTAWVGGCILKPVYDGEIQCRCLGASLYAYDDAGKPVKNEVGEMVITRPMPCMPVFLWKDKDFKRYHASYFEKYPGKWRHGDWIRITPNEGVVILGRSDATLNRHGVRIGTAEVYRALNKLEEIRDALIVNLELSGGKDYMPLFVVLEPETKLTPVLKEKIKETLRDTYSPRHVPDAIFEVSDLPYTISGKKMEAPVKNILMGKDVKRSVNKGTMRNPETIDYFVGFAREQGLNQF